MVPNTTTFSGAFVRNFQYLRLLCDNFVRDFQYLFELEQTKVEFKKKNDVCCLHTG